MIKHLLLACLLPASALAQGVLEVIPLRHRTAEQVIPVLRPMLEPGGALSGQYNQLIVRTSPANLEQLRAVLEAIDRPARRLQVSVRFDGAAQSASSGLQADVRISNRGSGADLRLEDRRAAQEERVDQRVQVLEGSQAWISTGEARVYGQAGTGFGVVPRVAGSTVQVDVVARQENFFRGGAIQGAGAASTVSGPLGEWIELGGIDTEASRADAGPFASRERASGAARRVWIKVEELR